MKNIDEQYLTEILKNLRDLLIQGKHNEFAAYIDSILQEQDTDLVFKLINSNEIWGGAGSIADQAFAVVDDVDLSVRFKNQLVILAEFVISTHVQPNLRISRWIDIYKKEN